MEDENVLETQPVEKKAVNLICPVHGDVTKSVLVVSLEDLANPPAEGETAKPVQYLYCLHCVNDLLLGLQETGKLPKVTVQEALPPETEQPKE